MTSFAFDFWGREQFGREPILWRYRNKGTGRGRLDTRPDQWCGLVIAYQSNPRRFLVVRLRRVVVLRRALDARLVLRRVR